MERLLIEGKPIKPYRLYRLGLKDEIIAIVAEGYTPEDLGLQHKRRLDWRYAVYYRGKRIS